MGSYIIYHFVLVNIDLFNILICAFPVYLWKYIFRLIPKNELVYGHLNVDRYYQISYQKIIFAPVFTLPSNLGESLHVKWSIFRKYSFSDKKLNTEIC